MSDAKCLKKEDDLSSGDDEEEMIVDGRVIDVDFEGFSPSDEDFDGIKQLLVQLFSSKCKINISLLTEAIIKQNFIGTVLKQSESPDDSDSDDACVYGIVTCYSLTRAKDELTSLLVDHFTEKVASAPISDKDTFIKIIESSTGDDFSSLPSCLGLIFNERFVNVPPQAAVPMFDNLLNELKCAKGHQHKSRFDFTHYLMICKVYEDFENFKGKASKTTNELFLNAEEEFFADESVAAFTYNVDSDDAVKKRKVLLLTQKGLEKAISKLKSKV